MSVFSGMEAAADASTRCLAVIPLLVGPLQVLLALLPAIFLTLGSAVLALFRPSTCKLGLRLLWRMKFSLLVLVALVFGMVQFIAWLWPAPRETQSPSAPVAEDYPMFRGGPQRLGFTPGSPEPLEGGVNWIFDRDNIAVYSTPTVAGKRVYFSTAGRGVAFNRGAVYCLEADTGELIWKASPPGMRAAVSAPATSGKYLVVGEGFHETQDANIFCLDLTQRGKVLWRQRTRNHVETTACIANGRVFIGAGDDGYYCVELEPDDAGRPRVVWHAPGQIFPDAETCPVVHDGKVFVGLGVDGNAVVCLDAGTGRQLWRTPTPYPVFTPPTICSNRIIVATGNGDYGTTGDQWAMRAVQRVRRRGGSAAEAAEAWRRNGPAGEVWSLDAATGEVAWRFRARDQIMGTIAADNGRLYFGSRDGFAYCLSLDGRELARWNAREPILACPAIGPKTAYFVTEPGRLFALDRETFSPVWESTLGSDRCMGSPTVANGRVYVGTPRTGLLCLGQPTDSARRQLWSGFLAGPGSPGGVDGWTPGESGMVVWAQHDHAGAQNKSLQTAPCAALNQRLFQPVAGGTLRGLVCWQAGAAPETNPTVTWRLSLTNGIQHSPAANADSVFVTDGSRTDSGRQLHCLDLASGRVRWTRPLGSGTPGDFVLGHDLLFVQDSTNTLTAFDAEGRPRWRRELGELSGPPAWQDNILVVAVSAPPSLLALDAPAGRTLWSVPVNARTSPVANNDAVFVGTTRGVVSLRLTDGARSWEQPIGEPAAPLAANDRWIVSLDRRGQVTVLNRAGGIVASWSGTDERLAPMLVRDAVILATRDALILHHLDTPATTRWLDTQTLGSLSAPPVFSGGAVYFSTESRGMIRAVSRP